MDQLPEKVIFNIFNYLSDEMLFTINDKHKSIALQILYNRIQCWGCIFNLGNQEGHYDGCLSN
jgi:hypothetical protein